MPVNAIVIGEERQRRTPNSKHYRLSDGSFKAIIASRPLHYLDADGQWQDINTDLYDEADFDVIDNGPISALIKDKYKARKLLVELAKKSGLFDRSKYNFFPLKVPYTCEINRNFKKGYSIGKGASALAFIPVSASNSIGVVDPASANTIGYSNVWNGADVKLEITSFGIKETITLKSNIAPAVFTFEVKGELADNLTSGELKLAPAWLEDANKVRRDVPQTVRRTANKTYVDITPDLSALSYPIAIDPTIIINPDATAAGQDAQVYGAVLGGYRDLNYGNSGTMMIGIDTSGYPFESFIKFDLSSIPAGSTITSASMILNNINPNGGGTPTVGVNRVLAAWAENGITWNNKPAADATVLSQVTAANNTGDVTFTGLGPVADSWVKGVYPNYGMRLYGITQAGNNFWEVSTSEQNVPSQRPRFTVTYTRPPTSPTVTAPNGGETWNSSHTITWLAGTDPDGDPLGYDIELSTDGANWKRIATYVSGTSYTYDFINETQTSTATIRIRASDNVMVSDWDYSNGVFTIQHNTAPSAPTNLSPANSQRDRTLIQRLSWVHNDQNADPQSKFDLQWRLQGSSAWNTITQVTTNQYWDAPANTFPSGTIEWQLRTYDQTNLSGPYSPQVSFIAGEKPATPTITAPGSTTSVARPLVQWSSFEQSSYQLQVLNQAQTATIWDSGEVITGNKAVTVGTDLQNGVSYVLKLKIKNSNGLWSDPSTASVAVSFTAPTKPVVTLFRKAGSQLVTIANPAPNGSEPGTSSNDLYRRKMGETLWVSLATRLLTNTSYEDFSAASGIRYEYMARAQGSNGTTRDSDTVSGSITFTGVWMHDIADPAGTIRRYKLDGTGRSASRQQNVTMMQYAGRTFPTAEFGESAEHKVPVQLEITRTSGDLEALQALIDSCATICYRDGRGRKVIGIIPSLTENDVRQAGYTVSFEMNEIEGEATPRSSGSVSSPPVTIPGGTTPPPSPAPAVAEVVGVRTTITNGQITRVQEVDSLGASVTQADLAWNVDGSLQNIIELDEWGRRHLVTLNYAANGDVDPVNPVTRTVMP